MTTKELLENPDMFISYVEPWAGRNRDCEKVQVPVEIRVRIRDAINLQREASFSSRSVDYTDEELLDSFIAINWATPLVEKSEVK